MECYEIHNKNEYELLIRNRLYEVGQLHVPLRKASTIMGTKSYLHLKAKKVQLQVWVFLEHNVHEVSYVYDYEQLELCYYMYLKFRFNLFNKHWVNGSYYYFRHSWGKKPELLEVMQFVPTGWIFKAQTD